MQTAGYGTDIGVGKTHRRTNRKGLSSGNDKEEKDSGAEGCRFPFLKTKLEPIAATSVRRQCHYGEVAEYMTPANFEYLRDSYIRYAGLKGVRPARITAPTTGDGISNVYDEMVRLAGNGIRVNIDYCEGKLYFTLWKSHDWSEWTLYWFPIKFIVRLNSRLRRICITFMHEFIRSNGLDTIDNCCDAEMTLAWIRESAYECDGADEKEYIRIADSYESGAIREKLRRIETKSYYKNLPRAVRTYEPANDYERKLIELMSEGLQFIGTDTPSIMHYSYDPLDEEEPDVTPIGLDRQIRIIYDSRDRFTEMLEETFNCDQRETYTFSPISSLELSPESESLFKMDDYPDRFFRWADKFISHIL